jgi:hypothetical protein
VFASPSSKAVEWGSARTTTSCTVMAGSLHMLAVGPLGHGPPDRQDQRP